MLTFRTHRTGFTLLELLAALGVVAIIVAVAVPSVGVWVENQRLQDGLDEVRASWAKARASAMEEGRAYRFQILADAASFRVAPNILTYWPEFANQVNVPEEPEVDEPQYWSKDYTLPLGITFQQATDIVAMGASNSESAFLFMPDGSAKLLDSDGQEYPQAMIILSLDKQQKRRRLELRALTCVVTQSGDPQ